MARGQHDQPDPNLILKGPRRPLPSKRVQGFDYPVTALEELQHRGNFPSRLATNSRLKTPEPLDSEKNYFKDITKPDGEACREDGTLKDASELEWPNSPSELESSTAKYDSEWDERMKNSWKNQASSMRDSDEDPPDIVAQERTNQIKKRKNVIESDEDEVVPLDWQTQIDPLHQQDPAHHLPRSDDGKQIPRKRSNSGVVESDSNTRAKKARKGKERAEEAEQSEHVPNGEEPGGFVSATSQVESKNDGSESDGHESEENETGDSDSEVAEAEASANRWRNDPTKDIRLCGQDGKGLHPTKNVLVDGWFCKFCLDHTQSKNKSFLTGNVTSRRRHLLRFHLDDYWNTCVKNGTAPVLPRNWKTPPGWVPPDERGSNDSSHPLQQSITKYVQKTSRPPRIPPVTKKGIQEHLLAIISTCDLPFRFVERPALRGFIAYLNHTLQDEDIPHKSAIAGAVNAKVVQLEELTFEIIDRIPSKVSTVWDGWSTRRRRPFTSFSISFIDSPPEDDTKWELKKYLLEFNSPVGRHTGELIGKDLVSTIRKFRIVWKLGWMVGDGVSSNDVAVRTVCKELDPNKKRLDPKQVRVLCIDHSMHRAAYHFIKALGVPSLMKTKRKLTRKGGAEDEEDNEADGQDDEGEGEGEDEDEADIDVSLDVEASADDAEAMAGTTIVDYDPGDTLGKLLGLVNQVRMSSDGVREFLAHACNLHGIKPIELLLWVWSRWGSLCHCLDATLQVQKAIDYFCLAADNNEKLPPLKNKSWLDYRLDASEWKLIKLVHRCLKVVADRHNELSNEELATCTRVLPMLELLMSEWEDLLEDLEFEPVHDALRAGISLLEKYYRRSDDTDVYFIAHVLDPVLKLEYLKATWDQEYLDIGLDRFKAQFLIYKAKYDADQLKQSSSSVEIAPKKIVVPCLASTDKYIEDIIRKRQMRKGGSQTASVILDPYDEINRYLEKPRLRREDCSNPIPWWGYQSSEPVLRLMARDYLAIPATTCIAERSFSLSARTDDPRRRQMQKIKFGGLQKIHAGYMDGRLSVEGGIMEKYIGDFTFDDEDYLN